MGLFCALMPFARSNANADGLQGHLSFFLIKKSMDIYFNSLLLITSIKSNTKELYHSSCDLLVKDACENSVELFHGLHGFSWRFI